MTKEANEYALAYLMQIVAERKKIIRRNLSLRSPFYCQATVRPIIKLKRLIFKLIRLITYSRFEPDYLAGRVLSFLESYRQRPTNPQEKVFSLDFLHYVLKNNPPIPYLLFEPQDHREIKRFVRNKFLLALFDFIDRNKLFENCGLKKQEDSNEYTLSFLEKEKIQGGILIDCGAFVGSTTLFFQQNFQPEKIIALEPDPINFARLKANISLRAAKNIVVLPKGVGATNGELFINLSGSSEAYLSPKAEDKESKKVEVVTLDNLVTTLKLTNIKLIKMDIEGLELLAVKGACQTISKFKPALIIALYHRGQDFFEIPTLLKTLVPDYKLRFINLDANSPSNERMLITQ